MCPVGLSGGRMAAVRLPTAALRASGLQYPRVPPFGYYLCREVAVHNCTPDPLPSFATCPRWGQFPLRPVFWGSQPYGKTMQRLRTCGRGASPSTGVPVEFLVFHHSDSSRAVAISSRFHHSPHQSPRLTPQPSIVSFVPLSRLALIFADGRPPHGAGTAPFRASRLVDARAVYFLSSGAYTKRL